MDCNLESDLTNEIRGKKIVHWNYRDLSQLPDAIRICAKDVQQIYLKDNKLMTLPDWIIELRNLTHLYLNGNNMNQVPFHLARIVHLAVLDLSGNNLEDLPPCLGDLESLEHLSLDDNFLIKLPREWIKLKNLRSLSICNNDFIALPEWLGLLKYLEQLRADENRLIELPIGLTSAPNLRVVSICSNRLTHLPLDKFVSSPSMYFLSNPFLNYLSYPIYRQLLSTRGNHDFEMGNCERNDKITSENKNCKIFVKFRNGEKNIIHLPRQLLKIHDVDDNEPALLSELALKKIYHSGRYTKEKEQVNESLGVYYNLLANGPIAVCVNENCCEPIFTEAWIVPAISCPRDSFLKSVTIVVLYCSKNCTINFDSLSEEFESLRWNPVHQR